MYLAYLKIDAFTNRTQEHFQQFLLISCQNHVQGNDSIEFHSALLKRVPIEKYVLFLILTAASQWTRMNNANLVAAFREGCAKNESQGRRSSPDKLPN